MKSAAPPRPTAPAPPPVLFERTKTIQRVRQLIYLYLILLIFEGALRKWVVPRFSDALLLIRDPVVVAIYLLALRARAFRWNAYTISAVIIGAFCWAEGAVVLLPYLDPKVVALVTAYGFRSNFLHLPLIFVIPAVFDFEDVKKIGWWTIAGMIPMGLLMTWQFHASPDSFINRVAGAGEGTQIYTSGGRIRPPGTFSFTSGAIFYVTTAAAFLLHAAMAKLNYKMWLLVGSAVSLIVSIGVSGSRGAVLSVAVVVAMLVLVWFVRPDAMTGVAVYVLVVVILAWAVSHIPIFRAGVDVLSERFVQSAEIEENSIVGGLASRTMGGFTEGLSHLPQVPVLGYGLGVGTNGGARFLMGYGVGAGVFLLSENEWTRILLESGSIFGLSFLIWRVAMSLHLFLAALRALKLGNTLPIFLFAAGVFAVLNAPLGQPTSAGFAVVLAGLCLAATRNVPGTAAAPLPTARGRRPMMGRSPFAASLHDTVPGLRSPNGSVDR